MDNVRTNIPFSQHTHNNNMCDTLPAPWPNSSSDRVSSGVKSLYEVLVMADYWYGYKRVGCDSQKASSLC